MSRFASSPTSVPAQSSTPPTALPLAASGGVSSAGLVQPQTQSQAGDLFGWLGTALTSSTNTPAADWVSEGFQIGWDFARHQLTPPADHLHEGHPVRQGWQSGRQRFAQRTLTPRLSVRLWLGLRLSAWARGLSADHPRLNAHYIGQLLPRCCPITREVLTWGQGQGSDAVVVWLDTRLGLVPGNLAVVSRLAQGARAGRDGAALQAMADLAASGEGAEGWTAERWQRWVSLVRAAQPEPETIDHTARLDPHEGHDAAHRTAIDRPLTALPPPRVRVNTPALGLQVLLSCCFMGTAYARRMMELAALLPTAPARRPYFLLMNALLARRMSAPKGADREALRHVMEDAWRHPIVVQRWRTLMQVLSAEHCRQCLRRATQRVLADGGLRWLDDTEEVWAQAA